MKTRDEPLSSTRVFRIDPLSTSAIERFFLYYLSDAAQMSLQVPESWLRAWVDAGFGPFCWYPLKNPKLRVTTLFDLWDWWSAPNFQVFATYVDERTAAVKASETWSTEKDQAWFRAYRHLLKSTS